MRIRRKSLGYQMVLMLISSLMLILSMFFIILIGGVTFIVSWVTGNSIDQTQFFKFFFEFLGQLCWPIVTLILVSLFTPQLRHLLKYLRVKIKPNGVVELSVDRGGEGSISKTEEQNKEEVNENTASGKQKKTEVRSDLIKLILLYIPGQLQLHNKGKEPLNLWGTKFSDTPRIIKKERRTIPEGFYYYFLTDKLEENARQVIGANGAKEEVFEIYLTDSNDIQYIAKFKLLIMVQEGKVTIHTQLLGVVEEKWKTL